ncbi:hypothetical protein [Aeromonas caviae]|uniref:hypothetical protein n=1 Tax=Aeromonas caviae TaxID=648 RepID=UPI003F747C52
MDVIYSRLARRGGIWRVDGIGTLTSNHHLGTRAVVHFSGLRDAGLTDPYTKSSLNGKTLKFPIHSASICFFIVGSVWKDGKRVLINSAEEELIVDLEKQKATPLNYRVNPEETGWIDTILPEDGFALGDNRTALAPTSYVHAPVINHHKIQRLIVPASELLRFYAGITSPLLSHVLQGQLSKYIDLDKSFILDDCVTLHAKKTISKDEAVVLARIVASPSMKRELLSVHQHISSTNSNNNILSILQRAPLLIKMLFPFDDLTTLKVSGKKIKISKPNTTPEVWAFFAMKIHSCSHPIGFSKILINGVNYATPKKSDKIDLTHIPQFIPLIIDENTNDYVLGDYPADPRLKRQVIQHHEDRFPELDAVNIMHVTSNESSLGNGKQTPSSIPVTGHTMEDGSSSKDAEGKIGADLCNIKPPDVSRDLSLFIDMLNSLRKKTEALNWSISTRSLNSGFVKDGECIALFPSEAGRCRSWHKIELSDDNTRPRQVIVTEISVGNGSVYFYLLEMELKPTEPGQCTILLHNNALSKVEDEKINEILSLTSIQNSWLSSKTIWKRSEEQFIAKGIFSTLALHRIPHPKFHKASDTNLDGKNKEEAIEAERKRYTLSWSEYIKTKIHRQRPLGRALRHAYNDQPYLSTV